jgi:ribonucleoside-diphosphate reductase alpha chain
MAEHYGPRTAFGQLLHSTKYRAKEEKFDDYCVRWSRATTDNDKDFRRALRYTRDQSLLPAGRQQHSMGRPYLTTAYNCFVGGLIPDSYEGILEALKLGGMTLRTGGGVGWNFDTLRPEGEPIRGLGEGSFSSGPISFMRVWDVNCETILTAGHRRGAMMATFSVHHPDILKFISAKRGTGQLRNFNISVTVTDEFMEALDKDGLYQLSFEGTKFGAVRATDVWARIMESNWDWAEPGVLFIDRINQRNPLWYCEKIYATNPCAEQPLPPNGACLLGSVNIVKCLTPSRVGNVIDITRPEGHGLIVDPVGSKYDIDWELLDDLIDTAVRCFDMVPERTVFPLEVQREEALNKRRMGVGVTGVANAIEVMGHRYGSPGYLEVQDKILQRVAHRSYRTSIELAREKGSFPLFDADKYLDGWFVNNSLTDEIRDGIRRHGLRNGLLLSIAPTGTISMAADNLSSGIEPPYAIEGKYTIIMPSGKQVFDTVDHAYEFYGVRCQTANETTAEQHIDVLCAAQQWVDSSISKTCNVQGQVAGIGPGVSYNDFKQLYMRAYEGGAKGCTTFNMNGKLLGVREVVETGEKVAVETEGAACRMDGTTGLRSCDL